MFLLRNYIFPGSAEINFNILPTYPFQSINNFMYVIPIYLSFIYFSIKSIGYFGIFLVISVNLRLFWYRIISTVFPSFWQC